MKFAVIGLGRFGYHIATTLAENGMEVMAVDSNESLIAGIRDQVTQAICVRITNEESLRNIGVADVETVIVAMGESFAESILITALLKKHLDIPTVITRATSDIHKEILKLIGADQVVLPEKEIGIRVADNLSFPFTDLLRLSKQFSISQIIAPPSFIGKTVHEIDAFSNYDTHCIGIKQETEDIISVSPDYIVKEGDRLIIAGENRSLIRISRE